MNTGTLEPQMTTDSTPAENILPKPIKKSWFKTFKKVLDTIFTLTLAVVVTAYFLFVHIIPLALGGTSATVLSGSMTPALPVGEVIISVPVASSELKVGDIVSYLPADDRFHGMSITHRVQSIKTVDGKVTEVVVKGDANPVADAPISPEQIKGKMIYSVPYVGNLNMYLHGQGPAPVIQWTD
jgi:signal peptidase